MPSGQYEKCLAQMVKHRKNGYTQHYTCYKKKGHDLSVGRDDRKHVDNKTAPAVYWLAQVDEPDTPMPFDTQLGKGYM